MNPATQAGPARGTQELNGPGLLILASAFGLLCGFGEAIAYLLFQHLRILDWDVARMHVQKEILYISPLVDLGLFAVAGVALLALGKLVRKLSPRFSVGVLTFFIFLDWIGLTGRIRSFGAFFLALGLGVAIARWTAGKESAMLQASRRLAPLLAGLAVLLFAGIEGGKAFAEFQATRRLPPAAPGSPNVLLIVLDTVRADHMSVYGYVRPTTPNLERIARGGVLFEQAFSTSSWTLPAHASLLTGHEAHEHGAEIMRYDGRFPTLAEEFQRRGFRTGAFSANEFFFTQYNGFGAGFLRFDDIFGSLADRFARTYYGRVVAEKLAPRLGYKNILGRITAAEVNRQLLAWVDRDPGRPFFAVINYFDAHDPYRPPQPYRSQFSKLPDPGGLLNELASHMSLKDPSLVQGEMDAYDGGVAYMDDQVGRLLEALAARSLLKNTCIVILSDHGEFFGEHGLYLHRNALYPMSIQVPLIFYWEGHLPAGVRVAEPPVSLTDVAATLMGMIPAARAVNFPGQSLVPLWSGKASSGDYAHPLSRVVDARWSDHFSLILRAGKPESTYLELSLVTPQWHYIFSQIRGVELYDRGQDPGETRNLAFTPQGKLETRLLLQEARDRGAFSLH